MSEGVVQHGGPEHGDAQHGGPEHRDAQLGHTKVSHLAGAIVTWACDCCFGML
jgi:hypothetical protein